MPSRTDAKGYGYGTPIGLDYLLAGDEPKSAVLHAVIPGPCGHERMADRAQKTDLGESSVQSCSVPYSVA